MTHPNEKVVNRREKVVDMDKFNELVLQGYNVKQLAEFFGFWPQNFGIKMKKILGMYPSVYIARVKRARTLRG